MKQGGDRRANRGFTQRKPVTSGGFTLVEVMIVLAVTGLIFISAVVTINGRQNKTEFQTATNSFLQQLQQISNETSNGYSESTNVQCVSGTPPTLTPGNSDLGTNGDCIFLGKVLQLGIGNVPDNQAMHVFPIVGNRLYSGQPVTTLAQAYPEALGTTQGGNDLNLESGLWLDSANNGTRMSYVPANVSDPDGYTSPIATRGVGFMSNLGNIGVDEQGNLTGGSAQQLSLYAVRSTDDNTTTKNQMKACIDASDLCTGGGLKQVSQVRICLESGGTGQSALYRIGGDNNNPVGVRMQIFSKAGCTNT